MQLFGNRARACAVATCGIALAGISASAEAGFSPPDLTMTVEVEDALNTPIFSDSYSIPASAPNGTGFYTYDLPNMGQPDFGFSNGGITGRTLTDGDAFPFLGTQLVPDFTMSNDTGEDLIFHISMIMPVTMSPAVDWTSVAGWSVSGPAGQSEVWALQDESMWSALIDDTVVGTRYDFPSGTNGSLETDPVTGSYGAVTQNVQIDLAFRLTGADDGANPQTVLVGVSGNFILSQVPAPGSLALLAVGAIIGSRRRRR